MRRGRTHARTHVSPVRSHIHFPRTRRVRWGPRIATLTNEGPFVAMDWIGMLRRSGHGKNTRMHEYTPRDRGTGMDVWMANGGRQERTGKGGKRKEAGKVRRKGAKEGGWGRRERNAPMEDVEQIARDRLPVLRDALLVHAPLERRDQLVAVLLDHEADQLLASRTARRTPPSDRRQQARTAGSSRKVGSWELGQEAKAGKDNKQSAFSNPDKQTNEPSRRQEKSGSPA